MKKAASLFSFIMISILILSACGRQSPASARTAAPELPTGTPMQPSDTPAGYEKTITLEDQDKTITLTAGERFLLKLGEEYIWNVQVSDQERGEPRTEYHGDTRSPGSLRGAGCRNHHLDRDGRSAVPPVAASLRSTLHPN